MELEDGSFVDMPPRPNRLAWGDHHMAMALLTAQRSPDPNTQVGACIVNQRNIILGTGYNAFPRGICSSGLPWDRQEKSVLSTKYPYVVHAEKNAIYNAVGSVEGARLYVTMYPCNECAKDIIQAGIKHIIYLSNPYETQWQTQASKRMLDMLDISVIQHQWTVPLQDILNSLVGVK